MPKLQHTIEQGRAKQAFEHVQEALDEGKDTAKNYKSYVKKLPALIQTNGLGTAMAFVKSKGGGGSDGTAYQLLYDHISQWLFADTNAYLFDGSNVSGSDLVSHLVALDSDMYRAVTRETLLLLQWLRRLADGMVDA